MKTPTRHPVSFQSVDPRLLGIVVALATFGLLMVGSASMTISADTSGNPFAMLIRQGIHLLVGFGLGWLVWHIPLRLWEKTGLLLLLASLLVLAVVPIIGEHINGSTRWLRLGGFNVQPSEFVKLFVLVYLAGFLVRRNEELATIGGFIKVLAVLGSVAALLLLEPDFGAAMVIMASGLGLIFLGGVSFRHFSVLMMGLFSMVGLLIATSDYRAKRILAYLHPWDDRYGDGFQLTQALVAFGRGDLTGTGLGASIQKLYYLPEAHTDFLFAIIGEELGLVGTIGLIVTFGYLVWRGYHIGRVAEQADAAFAAFLAYGISLWLGLQGFINMGVNVGLLPTKGLTLPLVSYGGSSLIVTCMAIGLLLRIHLETNPALQRRGARASSRRITRRRT